MCGISVGKEVFISVLLGGGIFIAWVDLYVNFVGGVPWRRGGNVYFFNNQLWLDGGVGV